MLVKVPQQYMLPVCARPSPMRREKKRASAPPATHAARPSAGRHRSRGSGEGSPHSESMAESGMRPNIAVF